MRCAVPIISLSEYIVHINEKQVGGGGHEEERHTRVNVILRAFGVMDGGEIEKTYGQEFVHSTHLFQVSIDNIPGFHLVLRCVPIS